MRVIVEESFAGELAQLTPDDARERLSAGLERMLLELGLDGGAADLLKGHRHAGEIEALGELTELLAADYERRARQLARDLAAEVLR